MANKHKAQNEENVTIMALSMITGLMGHMVNTNQLVGECHCMLNDIRPPATPG